MSIGRTSPGGDDWYRQGGVEPKDFVLSNDLPTWKGNAIEYIFRAGKKPQAGLSDAEAEIQDIKKAIWWLEQRLELVAARALAKVGDNGRRDPKVEIGGRLIEG